MTSREFKERLGERLARVNTAISPKVYEQLEAYYRLLERWNQRINLTSLPLTPPSDETFDRLLVEPILAAPHVADSAQLWFDLGSGGGSPAIPLKILRPRNRLVMIESRARKTAFLREAVRNLELNNVHVETARFEDVAAETPVSAHLVTVRAVRGDDTLFSAARDFLRPDGLLLWFRPGHTNNAPPDFRLLRTAPLTDSSSELAVMAAVPRAIT